MAKSFVEIWKSLSSEDRLRAAEAFWSDKSFGPQQQTTMGVMAQRLHFRPKTLKSLPAERKARMLIELPGIPAEVIMGLLAAFHLTHRKDMLVEFLNAAGIEHENGLLTEAANEKVPTAESIHAAVEAIRAKYPADQVNTYLEVLYTQDPEYWKELKDTVA